MEAATAQVIAQKAAPGVASKTGVGRMATSDAQGGTDVQGLIVTSVVPGEGARISLRGVLDASHARELEAKLAAAYRAYPPVTVDLSGTVSIDSTIVDVLAEASASFPEGLRVQGPIGRGPHQFDSLQVEHLLAR